MTALIALALAAALAAPAPCNDELTINIFDAWQNACPAQQQPVEPAE